MDLTAAVQKLVLSALQAACELDPADLSPETDLGDIGFDSLGLTAIVARAESQLRVEFSSDDILAMYQALRIADLVQVIESAILAQGAANGAFEARG